MTNSSTLLHTGTSAVTDGGWFKMAGPLALLRSYLSAAGGSATVNVYGRTTESDPSKMLVTFTLSGANDAAEYLLEEPRLELKAEIAAIAGGATATAVAGY